MFKQTIFGLSSLLLPLQLFSGGMCLYEIGTADVRLASAGWSARAQDPSTLFTNPAGMTRLCEKQLEVGAQPIFAHFHFNPDSDTDLDGHDGQADIWLPSGSFFYVHPYNDKLTFGFGSFGYFGADLVYNHDWVGRYYIQKILLEGLSFVPAAAYQINKRWSIGVGANIMYGFIKQRSAVRNTLDGVNDGYFNFHDYRFGFGGLLGILYEPNCTTRFGIQYLTPVRLGFQARPKFHDIGPSLELILKELGVINSKFNVHVNVPQSVMLSAYHQLNSCIAIMGNMGWQQWSKFEKVTVDLSNLNNSTITSKVKYQDTWHAALGMEWSLNQKILLSAGVAYDSSAISTAERTLDFPVGDQWRIGTGLRWDFTEKLTFDFSTELQWQGNLKTDVDKPVVGHVVGAFKDTYIYFLSANVIYSF